MEDGQLKVNVYIIFITSIRRFTTITVSLLRLKKKYIQINIHKTLRQK